MKVPGALTIALLFAVSTQTSQAMPGFMPERELRGAGKVSCTAHGLAPLLPPPQAVTKSFYRCLLAVSRDLCEPCDGDLACIKSGSGPAVMRRTPECRGIPVPSMRRLKTQTSQVMPGWDEDEDEEYPEDLMPSEYSHQDYVRIPRTCKSRETGPFGNGVCFSYKSLKSCRDKCESYHGKSILNPEEWGYCREQCLNIIEDIVDKFWSSEYSAKDYSVLFGKFNPPRLEDIA